MNLCVMVCEVAVKRIISCQNCLLQRFVVKMFTFYKKQAFLFCSFISLSYGDQMNSYKLPRSENT